MQLKQLDPRLTESVYGAMEEAFPREERRTREAHAALANEPRYKIYMAEKDGERVGFITVWELDSFTFADHFVIFPAHRNKGYGSAVLQALAAHYPALVLEAEPPEDPLKRRRLAFYRRNGFFENDYPYLQPSFHGPGAEVPLVLMSYPAPLPDPESTAQALYAQVYRAPWRT